MEPQPMLFPVAGGDSLAGTLVRPATPGPLPAALLLSGSGPLDRDSNIPGQRVDVSRALAEALAERGIATFRFDKRGVGESGGNYLETGFETETDDAGSGLAALARTEGIDPGRLFVIGHSAGATIAIRLASTSPRLAGAVLLSAAASPGLEVMRWQSEQIATATGPLVRPLRPLFLRWQERTRRRLLASTEDTIRIFGQGELPARWLREFMAYDPRPDLARVRCPVLAITGQKDIQVDPADGERMRELVAGSFAGDVPADLTHVLRCYPGRAGLASYRHQLRLPVDADLLRHVSDWVGNAPSTRTDLLAPLYDPAHRTGDQS